MGQRNILAVKTFDVTHHLRLRMIFVEYFVCKERRGTFYSLVYIAFLRDVIHLLIIFSRSNGKDRKQHIGGCYISRFVNTEPYVSVFEITQIYFLAKSYRTDLLCRNVFGQFEAQGIEVLCIHLRISEFLQLFIKEYGDTVDT